MQTSLSPRYAYTLAALSSPGGIASLREKSTLDVVKNVEIVVFDFAQFEKVERGFGTEVGKEIDGERTERGLEKNGHDGVDEEVGQSTRVRIRSILCRFL